MNGRCMLTLCVLLLLTAAGFAPLLCNHLPLLARGDTLSPAARALHAWDVLAMGWVVAAWMVFVRARARMVWMVLLLSLIAALLAPHANPVMQADDTALLWAPVQASAQTIDGASGPLAACSTAHPLGTDRIGRDLLARVLFGLRNSVGLALAAALGGLCIGGVLGCLAALLGARSEATLTLLMQALAAYPALLVVLVLQGLTVPSVAWLIALLLLLRVSGAYRLIRTEALRAIHGQAFVAARADGLPTLELLRRELWPALRPVSLVHVAFGAGAVILIESSLSFLGFGLPEPLPSLGELLQQGRTLLPQWSRLLLLPAVLIVGITAFSLQRAAQWRAPTESA